MRRRAAGRRDGVMPGEAVPYVICVRLEQQPDAAPEAADAEGAPAQQQQEGSAGEQGAAGDGSAAAPGQGQQQQQQQGKQQQPKAAAKQHLADRAYHPVGGHTAGGQSHPGWCASQLPCLLPVNVKQAAPRAAVAS
jgi:hypothetical protein